MIKTKFKFIILFFMIIILLLNPICYCEDNISLISNIEDTSKPIDNISSDLYISEEDDYNLKNIVDANVFSTNNNLTIDSYSQINGNLYGLVENLYIKSDLVYSSTEKNEIGDFKISSINSVASISGNVFVLADKFVLEPGCKIGGDLYICANEVDLQQNSTINGDIFVIANKLTFNCKANYGNLYATVKDFNMGYYGFIENDLHLTSNTSTINGYISRNAYIDCKNVIIENLFEIENNLNIENATSVLFSGIVNGDANIESKNITFQNNANNCKINGNFTYSSSEEISIDKEIVLGDIQYTKLKSSNTIWKNLLDYTVNLIKVLLFTLLIYFIIKKFVPNFLNKLSSINAKAIITSFAIGLGILIIVPIISLLLFISNIGIFIGLSLLVIYIFLLIIAKPLFILWLSSLLKTKKPLNNMIYILILTFILSLMNLIPYLGIVVSLLTIILGLGLIITNRK